ncbi:MFS transporter [Demequina capsici]|uniref:MFS transporter n=1 Tax=Demequina capsici TaxID=3075620 RepID=A0AA96J6E1_9MICO|nr:MFS transporter [Demequina sp. OYTSA14]WNM24132.1 MFS transporter [Demequina sp. OYTSA14]
MVTADATSAARTLPATGLSLAAASYVLAVVMMGTTMPTPLYPLYEDRFGFGSATATVLYAIYAAGVIASLVLFGTLSDVLGRRPLLLAGLVLSLASAGVFLVADHMWLLFVGRVLSGLAAGILTATGTVVVLENAPAGRARLASSLATASNVGGLGLGMLMAGAVAQVASEPLRAPFVVHALLLVVGVLALWPVRERGGRPGAARGLRLPRLHPGSRSLFATAAVGAVAGFAVSGIFASLLPGFMGSVLHVSAPVVVGFATFLFFGVSAVAQISLKGRSDRTLVRLGAASLAASMVLLAAALMSAALVVVLASSALGGAGMGLLFMTGMRAVTVATPPEARTQVTTAYFLVSYLSISVPVIAAGALSTVVGLTWTGLVFAALLGAVALVALAGAGRFTGSDGARTLR